MEPLVPVVSGSLALCSWLRARRLGQLCAVAEIEHLNELCELINLRNITWGCRSRDLSVSGVCRRAHSLTCELTGKASKIRSNSMTLRGRPYCSQWSTAQIKRRVCLAVQILVHDFLLFIESIEPNNE